jgi:hypothetical protein
MMRVPDSQGQIRILFGCPLQARWDGIGTVTDAMGASWDFGSQLTMMQS